MFKSSGTGTISRRRLVNGLLGAVPAIASARGFTPSSSRKILAYVGTFSSPQGPEGSKGRGPGICLFEMDPHSGKLTQRETFGDGANPSWLAFNADRTRIYAVHETPTRGTKGTGSVSALSVDPSTGHLTLLNTVSSEGAGPTHLSVHPSGKYVLVANYSGGSIAVLPVGSNGELGHATDVKEDQGKPGPDHAASAPPGSFAISGHDHPHAHMIQPDPSGRFVLAADLAIDKIFVWKFDVATGKLSPAKPDSIPFPPGDGPRHFTFHPNGHWLYSLQEEASTIAAFDYDAANGTFKPKQTISSLPKGFAGTNFTSEIMVEPRGRFLYAANRLHDTIAYFAIGTDGRLTFIGEEWTRGDYPRSFNIDPTGNFLYSCNQRGDSIVTFRVNRQSGALTFTGQYTPVGTPSNIIFKP